MPSYPSHEEKISKILKWIWASKEATREKSVALYSVIKKRVYNLKLSYKENQRIYFNINTIVVLRQFKMLMAKQ